MPIGLIALGAFIAVIITCNVVLKRNMGEAMLLGLLTTALFAGTAAPQALLGGLRGALEEEVLYAAIAFVFMAYVVDRTGLIHKLLEILNSLFGRFRGGPALVDTAGSAAMGALSGSRRDGRCSCNAGGGSSGRVTPNSLPRRHQGAGTSPVAPAPALPATHASHHRGHSPSGARCFSR